MDSQLQSDVVPPAPSSNAPKRQSRAEMIEFMRQWSKKTGILLEEVYVKLKPGTIIPSGLKAKSLPSTPPPEFVAREKVFYMYPT